MIRHFADANGYKPEIVAEMMQMTGRDVAIEGPVLLALLAAPAIAWCSGLRMQRRAMHGCRPRGMEVLPDPWNDRACNELVAWGTTGEPR